LKHLQTFEEFAHIPEGRSNPVECDNNSLSDDERNAFLGRVVKLNGTQFNPNFWVCSLNAENAEIEAS